MALTSTLLLPNTANAMTVTGDPVRADGGYGSTGYHFTVAIYTTNLQGTVHIEATVEDAPADIDWFQAVPAITFPRPGTALTTSGETAAVMLNFPGNFAHIRARLSRDGFAEPGPTDVAPYGSVDRILLNR